MVPPPDPHGGPGRGADPFDLDRFVRAQTGVHERAVAELRGGRKYGHWMWFVFPQLEGLGSSATARRYALSGADEARAYLAHPVLGPRLREAAEAALHAGQVEPALTVRRLMGTPDDLKLRSSATLFAAVAEDPAPFQALLDRYYDGEDDPRTEAMLEGGHAGTIR
jgi:uncharacterized protein (DUF1810 family)